ncbi:FAD-binding domain-containing protein [Pisolithus marmoratus]|nr:FAD-binding domain-containing protein [Pisolithus marmoratus]
MIFFPSLSLLLATGALATRIITDPRAVSKTCETISAAVSFASAVHYSGPSYEENIRHWASSSTQRATCSFEPGTASDIGIALQILGKDRVPFAVKGGGHTLNPGFSSTTGIQIAMSRFSEIVYDPESRTVVVGAGVIWDDVYAALEPHGVNVVGGRVSGIGVAGFTLGGGMNGSYGYSWLTNQYGLALNNVESFELVLPNGTVIDVTESSHPDLFFGLRGGYNNFGIVTKFVLNTYPQGQIWGGVMIYPETSVDQVTHATANFSASNDDPKAQMIMTTNYATGNHFVVTILFYDSPDPAPGVFDAFLGIPVLIKDVKTRSFLSLVLAASSFPEADPSPSESLVEPLPQGLVVEEFPSIQLSQPDPINATLALRGAFNTVTVTKYSIELIEAAINESIHWGQTLMAFSGVFISYDFTPIMPTALKRSSTSSAWPPTYKDAIIPIVLYIAWISESSDNVMHDMVRRSMSTLLEKAVSFGLDIMDAPLYSNCALFDTPIERMYGNNIERLRKIKNDVDPYSVMSLTGGFKF